MTISTVTLQDKVTGMAQWIAYIAGNVDVHPAGSPGIDQERYRKEKIPYIVWTPISDIKESQPEASEIHKDVGGIEEIDQFKRTPHLLRLQVMFISEDETPLYARKIAETFDCACETEESLEMLQEAGFSMVDTGPIIDVDYLKENKIQRRSAIELELSYETSSTESMNVMEVIEWRYSVDDITQTHEIATEV